MTAAAGFTYVADLLRDISQKIRPCPRITLQRAYVRAVREWCRQTQWHGVNIDAVLTVGSNIYDLNLGTQLESINVDSMQLQPLPMAAGNNPVPLGRANSVAFIPDNTEGQPVFYAYLPEGAFALDRAPDKAYPVVVRVLVQPTGEATEIMTVLLTKWRTAFEAGALSYLYDLRGEPFADPREAERQRLVFRSYINDGKADKNRGYVVGSVRATPRPFVTRTRGWRGT